MTELKMVYELVISRANPLDNCALNSIKSKAAVYVIHFIHNFTEIQNTTKGFQYQDNNIFCLFQMIYSCLTMCLIGAFQKFILRIVSDSFDSISSFVKYLFSR